MSYQRISDAHARALVVVTWTILIATACDAQMPRPVVWYNGIIVNDAPIKKFDEWSQRLSETWHLGTYKPSFRLAGKAGRKVTVDTCDGLFKADAADTKLSPDESFNVYRAWAQSCYASKVMASAKKAKVSHLSDFKLDKKWVGELPARLSLTISKDDQRRIDSVVARHGGLVEATDVASMKFKNTDKVQQVTVTDKSGGVVRIDLVGKGDFNGDGIEDLLVATTDSIDGGDYQSLGLYTLTKTKPNAAMMVIRQFPVMPK